MPRDQRKIEQPVSNPKVLHCDRKRFDTHFLQAAILKQNGDPPANPSIANFSADAIKDLARNRLVVGINSDQPPVAVDNLHCSARLGHTNHFLKCDERILKVLENSIGAGSVKCVAGKAKLMSFRNHKLRKRRNVFSPSPRLRDHLLAVVDTHYSTPNSDQPLQFACVLAKATAQI